MSTVIELSDAMAKSLDERSREEQVTSEEVIRRALESYLGMRLPSFEAKAAREPGPWPELENVLGAWRNPDGEEAVVFSPAKSERHDVSAGDEVLRPFPELDAVFGTWKDREEDTFAYLRRIRGE